MTSRRQFIKSVIVFFISLLSIKYFKIAKAMQTLPYHHLPNGTFRNLPGAPKRQYSSRNSKLGFFRFFYKGIIKKKMFDQKEIPDNIPINHALSQQNALKQFYNNTDLIKGF